MAALVLVEVGDTTGGEKVVTAQPEGVSEHDSNTVLKVFVT